MNEQELHSLYVHPKIKAMINFGHGEGFGLPLFEAAACSLPVIATDWSAHTEFLSGQTQKKYKQKHFAYKHRNTDFSKMGNAFSMIKDGKENE